MSQNSLGKVSRRSWEGFINNKATPKDMASKQALEAEIARLRLEQQEMQSKMQAMQGQLIEQVVKATIKQLSPQKDPIQAEVLWRLRRTRREFVYKKIIELLHTKQRELAELKYLIVDQGKYCSKATFYRYVDELGGQGKLSLMQANERMVVAAHDFEQNSK